VQDERWWQGAVIYQIYPRSFADADGDGIGDLPGILSRLDHLRGGPMSLDVDAIWLSPFYPSPLADFGYDVSDFTGVDPEFGTLDDLDRLIAACHARGLRVLLDLVANHTSDQHPWFVEARSTRDSQHRAWYWWADPRPDGGPPNNWTSAFGDPSWLLDEGTGQYYLHSFFPEQPDLNWANPAVSDAMADVMRFWMKRGIDGFRVDAIDAVGKDPFLSDNPPELHRPIPFPADRAGQYRLWNRDRPEAARVVRAMRRVADEFDDRVLLGEAYVPAERIGAYAGDGCDDRLHIAFDFELFLSEWDADLFGHAIARGLAYSAPDTAPAWAFSNHDQRRHASRFGLDAAPLAALILLTLRGTCVLYAGEEIGMVDGEHGTGPVHDRVGRDRSRTPMQWDGSPSGGFSTGRPWLAPVDPQRANVADQARDPGSLFVLYRRLIALRASSPVMRRGDQRMLHGIGPGILAWTRSLGSERVLVLANMAREEATVDVRRVGDEARGLLGTVVPDRDGQLISDLASLHLDGLEGRILELAPSGPARAVIGRR
jgi:alpha-glucosidase